MSCRISLSAMLALVPLLFAVHALADDAGTTALVESDFTVSVQVKEADGSWTQLSSSEAKTTFDRARCNCGNQVRFVVQVATSTVTSTISSLLATSGVDGEARLYLSQSSTCLSDPTTSGCELLDAVDDLGSLVKNGYWISQTYSLADLFGSATGRCDLSLTQNVWLWIDTASDGTLDLTGGSAPSLNLRLDGKPPQPPSNLVAQGGQKALLLSWDASSSASSTSSDLAGYLVFCARNDGSAAYSASLYDSQYVSPATLSANSVCSDADSLPAAFVGTADGQSTAERSADTTKLRLIPTSLLLVYRMDVLAERWRVPLVPYAKLGLNYTFWKVLDGNGDVATLTQGGRGAGGTAGWQVAGGLALQLDILDPVSMRSLDAETGLNHMYAFVEFAHVDASGLGMQHKLHVGDTTWSAGLMIEF